jgi:predicted metal-dependent peptidase
MNKLPTLMQKAKAQLCIYHGFFASLIMSLPLIEDYSIPTACTNMEWIKYNPDFIKGLNDMKLVLFVMAHEVCHVMFKHGLRLQGRNIELWNIACDHAVNLFLKAAGFSIWSQAYCDERFKNMSAEMIYNILRQEGGGEGWKCAGGMGQDLAPPGDGKGGDAKDQADIANIERKITAMVSTAYQIAKMQGTMPNDLERLINGIINPPLPWDELLRHYAMIPHPERSSWSRRNRRFHNIYLPTSWGERMGEVVAIGDTSTSMGEVYAQVSRELETIAEYVRPERIRMIWADDADCSRMEVWEHGEPVMIHPKGGGGTDMRKPCLFVEQFEPIVVIMITDCETPWPKEPTPYPLIVVSTTTRRGPEWAETVHFYGVGP